MFLAGLAYSVLIAIGVEQAITKDAVVQPGQIVGESPTYEHELHRRISWAVVVGVLVLLLPGLPLVTGSFAERSQATSSSPYGLVLHSPEPDTAPTSDWSDVTST